MPRISWNEIQDRAAAFASRWAGETYEKGESQSFWSDFLAIYDIDRRRHGAFFEYAIKKGSGKQGFIDLFWPRKLLAEQKFMRVSLMIRARKPFRVKEDCRSYRVDIRDPPVRASLCLPARGVAMRQGNPAALIIWESGQSGN